MSVNRFSLVLPLKQYMHMYIYIYIFFIIQIYIYIYIYDFLLGCVNKIRHTEMSSDFLKQRFHGTHRPIDVTLLDSQVVTGEIQQDGSQKNTSLLCF